MQYIDKSALVAEIERRIEAHKETLKNCDSSISEMVLKGSMSAYQSLLYFLDTLEVKDDVVSNDPISKDLKTAAGNYAFTQSEEDEVLKYYAFIAGAKWQKEYLWKDAQGDNLPEIDREVIVLVKALPKHEDSLLKVAFAHRPPEYWEGKNIITGEITRYKPKRYDKGEWNIPDVKYWIDIDLSKVEE